MNTARFHPNRFFLGFHTRDKQWGTYYFVSGVVYRFRRLGVSTYNQARALAIPCGCHVKGQDFNLHNANWEMLTTRDELQHLELYLHHSGMRDRDVIEEALRFLEERAPSPEVVKEWVEAVAGVTEECRPEAGAFLSVTDTGKAPQGPTENTDPLTEQADKYPAYWRPLPDNWQYIDTYRVARLFPLPDASGRLVHARKKLLVPGTRTGGKSFYHDIKEAHATIGQWLLDNKPED